MMSRRLLAISAVVSICDLDTVLMQLVRSDRTSTMLRLEIINKGFLGFYNAILVCRRAKESFGDQEAGLACFLGSHGLAGRHESWIGIRYLEVRGRQHSLGSLALAVAVERSCSSVGFTVDVAGCGWAGKAIGIEFGYSRLLRHAGLLGAKGVLWSVEGCGGCSGDGWLDWGSRSGDYTMFECSTTEE